MKKIIQIISFLLCCSYLLAAASAASMSAKNNEKNEIKGEQSESTYRSEFPDPVRYNRVHTAGLLWLNMTNFGQLGHAVSTGYTSIEHCTGKRALGSALPGGSFNEYIYAGSILFGGYLDSATTPEGGKIFQGPLVSSGYDGWSYATGISGAASHAPMELWPTGFSNYPAGVSKNDGRITEISNVPGRVNCFYNPVYDSTANAHEQFTTWYSDRLDDITWTGVCDADHEFEWRKPIAPQDAQGHHIPMGIEVKQTSYAWSSEFAQKFVIIDYTIYNTNTTKDIYNFYMGLYLDCDVGNTKTLGYAQEDLGGFIQKATVLNESTGGLDTVNLNMTWVADNDGRDLQLTTDPGNDLFAVKADEEQMVPQGRDLKGATAVTSIRVLRNPNPKLRYSFNLYNAKGDGGDNDFLTNDDPQDWGPRWKDGLHSVSTVDGVTNIGDWRKLDLTYNQKGYSDGNPANDKWGVKMNQGGMTEGRPLGDAGRYMVMSNGEFDYNLTDMLNPLIVNSNHLADVSPAFSAQELNTPDIYKQGKKWRPWVNGLGEQADDLPGFADGTTPDKDLRVELGNGADTKYVLSFGPLGKATNIPLATSASTTPVNKEAYRFQAGDSIKLTIAFIVSENFHKDKTQNPRYPDMTKMNWADAYRNAIWATRLYDVPMLDTPVKNNITGLTKGDGWYGEDVGADGIFAEKIGDACWWLNNQLYTQKDIDGTEGNYIIDTIPGLPPVDGYASTEDVFLKFGNTTFESEKIGKTTEYGTLEEILTGTDPSAPGAFEKVRVGWHDKLLTHGDGIPDFSSPEAPPSPKIKVTSNGSDVEIQWTSDNFGNLATSPEITEDKFSRRRDFEGYQVWVSPTNIIKDFTQIFSVDRENFVYEDASLPGILLDVPFIDVNTPSTINPGQDYTYIADIIHQADGTYDTLTVKGKNNSTHLFMKRNFGNNLLLTQDQNIPGLLQYKAVKGNDGVWTYTAILKNKILANKSYVAITSSDYGDPRSGVPALNSSPMTNSISVVPGKINGDNKVYVVPNPYRADVDYEATGWETAVTNGLKWTEQDRKIVFFNIPKQAIIRVYTLSGDLVKTVCHNGSASESNKFGEYSAIWNLLNENNQAVASGIYLFSCEDVENVREKFVGKFVIIK